MDQEHAALRVVLPRILDRVADHYWEALMLLDKAGYEEVSFFLHRERQTVPVVQAATSLLK